jgi:hypothetical protein
VSSINTLVASSDLLAVPRVDVKEKINTDATNSK